MTTPPVFVCPICQRQSWHLDDARERYCISCGFVDEPFDREGKPREPAKP